MKFLGRLSWFVTILLLSAPLLAQTSGDINGKVTAVIDGNTLEIKDNHNQVHKVMLAGIDCPELGQAYGTQSKKFLEKIALKKTVTATLQGKDRLGNYLAVVMIDDDVDPRIELLKEGLAWTAERNPNADLEPYRSWAEQKKRGLWQEQNPTPPWTYRRQQTMLQPKSS